MSATLALAGGLTARPHLYEQRVIGFLDHALLGKE